MEDDELFERRGGPRVQGQCAPTRGRDQSELLFLRSFRFAHLALTALRASSRRSSGVSCAIRAFPPFRPPNRPRATAFGFFRLSGVFFFFLGMVGIQDTRKDDPNIRREPATVLTR